LRFPRFSESIINLTFVNKMGNWPLGNIVEDIFIKSEEGGEGYNAGCIALIVFIRGMHASYLRGTTPLYTS